MGRCDNERGAAVRMTCAISDLCSGSRWRPEDAICRAAIRKDRKSWARVAISRPIRAWDILSVPSPDDYAAGIPPPATICEDARVAGSAASRSEEHTSELQ